MKNGLLSRDQFRESVFKRDGYKCVVCKEEAKDAHRIIERRLFSDGGYYIDNGASLCQECHILAEKTEISCDKIRELCGISSTVIPEHLYRDNAYDKWGNIILINGQRLKGELFYDESVQKIIKSSLGLFMDYVKYPRTYHLPWSEGLTKDDRQHKNLSIFQDKEVVVTEKMDGENASLYCDYMHARSIDSQSHPTQSYVRQLQGKIGQNIPKGWRVCGENLFAKHSIKYDNLSDYFLMFSIWNEVNECLSWGETVEWAGLLDLKMVPLLYEGKYDEETIKSCFKKGSEGYVLRLKEGFNYSNFKNSVAKFVRKNHIQTSHHWRFEKMEKNGVLG